MDCKIAGQEKKPLQKKTPSQIEYARDNWRKMMHWKKMEQNQKLFGHRDVTFVWRKRGEVTTTWNIFSAEEIF